jgi:hypothetical protein
MMAMALVWAVGGQTTGPATRPALKAIEVRSGVYLLRVEVVTTVSPEGVVRRVRTENKSYGANDKAGPPRVEVREGRLTEAQMEELAKLFDGWEKWEDRYGGVPDGGTMEVTYGGKRVRGGSRAPEQVQEVVRRVEALGEVMPVVAEKN